MARRLDPIEWLEALELPAASELRDRTAATLSAPGLKEVWKYTRLDGFLERMRAAGVARPQIGGADQPGVSVQSSRDHKGITHGVADDSSASRFPLADLALLMTGEMIIIRIDAILDEPIELSFTEGIQVPVLIELSAGSRVVLNQQTSAEQFCNHSLYITLDDGASLEHTRLALNESACDWSLTEITQQQNSNYLLRQYFMGGGHRRAETHVLLDGPNAQAHAVGAFVVDNDSHLDQQLVVEHRAAGTLSRQKFHGIGAGKGTSVFNGRIHIHPHAPGSDAALSNRNLALDPGAQMNTKPELEIYTDDVKCAHGATVGQLSEESLFYLQSRGLTRADARRILCTAFIRECIEGPFAEQATERLLGFASRAFSGTSTRTAGKKV